ncbi:MAG: hypothetical protein DHS20C11_17100 [Lysobacteraceae bacterium]|nr:MAG: hypothetical protein DHS20C11_17100 [Xanthomonadaceae bacterium]
MSASSKFESVSYGGFVDRVSKLTGSLVLIDGWAAELDGRTVQLIVESADGEQKELEGVLWFTRSDLPDKSMAFSAVMSLDIAKSIHALVCMDGKKPLTRLRIQPTQTIAGNAVQRIIQLRKLYGEQQWAQLQSLLRDVTQHGEQSDQVRQVNSLAINEPPDNAKDLKDRFLPSNAVTADLCIALDERHLAIVGWGRDVDERIESLEVRLLDGTRLPILKDMVRYHRPDVCELLGERAGRNAGLAICLETPTALEQPHIDLVVFGTSGFQTTMRVDIDDSPAHAARQQLLASFAPSESSMNEVFSNYLSPALGALQARLKATSVVDQRFDFGTVPKDPETTVIVPAYHGLEFITQQVIDFARDADFESTELIYVLDSPAESAHFLKTMGGLHALYGLSFRVLVLERNVGFSAANNIAAREANGTYLLLLNQDVIPSTPGWLGQLVEFHKKTPDAGAVGVKLLYEDDSIQHAGMYFDRLNQRSETWKNFHYFKGLHKNFEGASETRQVPGVTAACLLVERALFQQLNGLDEEYILGDFEDSDFCLKCLEAGKKNYYFGEVELYHLERQSFGSLDQHRWRAVAQEMNEWRQTQKWNSTFEKLLSTEP